MTAFLMEITLPNIKKWENAMQLFNVPLAISFYIRIQSGSEICKSALAIFYCSDSLP